MSNYTIDGEPSAEGTRRLIQPETGTVVHQEEIFAIHENKIYFLFLSGHPSEVAKPETREILDHIIKSFKWTTTNPMSPTNNNYPSDDAQNIHGDFIPSYSNGFSVQFPSDWNLASSGSFNSIGNDLMIHKGTREFTLDFYNDSEYSLMDTDSFGGVYFDSYKEMDGVVITDSLARINLGTMPEEDERQVRAVFFGWKQGDPPLESRFV